MSIHFAPTNPDLSTDPSIVDWTLHADLTHCRRELRPLEQIDSVVLQCMGADIGDIERRYAKVNTHSIATGRGVAAVLHKPERHLRTAYGLNYHCVGLMLTGNLPNSDGMRYRKNWLGSDNVTKAQVRAARCLLRRFQRELPNLKYIYAMRECSQRRRDNPGPDAWYHVGEWAIRELGLRGSSAFAGGTAIPDDWRKPRFIRGGLE